jgi:hypothetical protein
MQALLPFNPAGGGLFTGCGTFVVQLQDVLSER